MFIDPIILLDIDANAKHLDHQGSHAHSKYGNLHVISYLGCSKPTFVIK